MLKKRTLTKTTSNPAKKTTKDYSAITDRIKPVSSLGLVLAALFYGRAGTGKTTLAATFPKPLLLLDVREKGTDSVSEVEGVDVLSIEDWDDFEQVYWFLKSSQNKYKTVVVDAVSQLQDYAIEKALEEDGKTHDLISKRQWGVAAGKLKQWIINYRDLVDDDINVVFLAHDRANQGEETDDDELMPSIGPRVMPSVASVLTASVKLIGNTFIRETHKRLPTGKLERSVSYCLRVGPHSFYETKVRINKGGYVPDILVDPSYNSLVSLMKGEFVKPKPAETPTRKTLTKGK